MKIDAHHHYWHYTPEEYGWIDDSMQRIRRDFLPADLAATIAPVGFEGVVTVQARQTLEETEWLLSLAAGHDFMRGVVGWVPLVDPQIRSHLERYAANPKLKAVRHVVQGEPDDQFILRADFNAGIATLRDFGLIYDILIFERHLPQTIQFVDCHPQQVFVLDHIAKPRIKENLLEPWRTNLRTVAQRENVYCKFSGLVTEADFTTWTPEQLRPYWETVLDAFGPDRLMFGSDWPVCLVASEYAQWFATVSDFACELSLTERDRFFGETATEAYRL
jgi:L-fuconolactonase